jgi:hypothetical protein
VSVVRILVHHPERVQESKTNQLKTLRELLKSKLRQKKCNPQCK